MSRCPSILALGLLFAAASAVAGDRDRPERRTPFVGVFYPAFVGAAVDATRCPDPAQPVLLSFTGTAQTSLGAATIAQSHCEGPGVLGFSRGRQTITFGDGTQLFGTYEGGLIATPTTPSDGLLVIDGRIRLTGGTGALQRARGKGLSAGTVDTRTGAAIIAVSGTL